MLEDHYLLAEAAIKDHFFTIMNYVFFMGITFKQKMIDQCFLI